ncbi:MAG: YicC family protein [Clostridia bacterium]|nr:YicC family protein [Clostridia bacterium]
MINSMTGYGRCEMTVNSDSGYSGSIIVEIKSVNHRYLEVGMRVNRDYGFVEDPVKKYIASKIKRGKVDVYISIGTSENAEAEVNVNIPLAKAYCVALQKIAESCPDVTNDITASLIAKYPDVLNVRKKAEDEKDIMDAVLPVVQSAMNDFIGMRTLEGENLKNDVLSRCDTISAIVDEIEERAPMIVTEYRERLTEKMKDILEQSAVDEQRIAMEAAIFADKIAVDEEIVRLRSHFVQMKNVINDGGAVGRKLDFIVQEMNREANTIGSKITDAALGHKVVDIKAELEKIREQIQNIE